MYVTFVIFFSRPPLAQHLLSLHAAGGAKNRSPVALLAEMAAVS
jgi:hypothetical protein